MFCNLQARRGRPGCRRPGYATRVQLYPPPILAGGEKSPTEAATLHQSRFLHNICYFMTMLPPKWEPARCPEAAQPDHKKPGRADIDQGGTFMHALTRRKLVLAGSIALAAPFVAR